MSPRSLASATPVPVRAPRGRTSARDPVRLARLEKSAAMSPVAIAISRSDVPSPTPAAGPPCSRRRSSASPRRSSDDADPSRRSQAAQRLCAYSCPYALFSGRKHLSRKAAFTAGVPSINSFRFICPSFNRGQTLSSGEEKLSERSAAQDHLGNSSVPMSGARMTFTNRPSKTMAMGPVTMAAPDHAPSVAGSLDDLAKTIGPMKRR